MSWHLRGTFFLLLRPLVHILTLKGFDAACITSLPSAFFLVVKDARLLSLNKVNMLQGLKVGVQCLLQPMDMTLAVQQSRTVWELLAEE